LGLVFYHFGRKEVVSLFPHPRRGRLACPPVVQKWRRGGGYLFYTLYLLFMTEKITKGSGDKKLPPSLSLWWAGAQIYQP